MKVFPIDPQFLGERILAIDPELKLYPESDWRRRLNNFSGRALTDTALKAEQFWRSGRIATWGQLVSPGIIEGLEIESHLVSLNESNISELYLSPGTALTASGEIISITRPIKALLKDVFVYDHAQHAQAEDGADNIFIAEPLPTLEEVLARSPLKHTAGILVLEPLAAEMNVDYDTSDPCELDPENYAYENWQLIDTCRLVLYTWPDDWLMMPVRPDISMLDINESNPAFVPAQIEQWRNRLAYAVFSKEDSMQLNELHPWEKLGVPLSVVGFNSQWNAWFLDGNAVVRKGGKRCRTTSVLPNIGNRFLWQAQFQQFSEHLAELIVKGDDGDVILQKARDSFRYLPPIGIVPSNFVTPRSGEQNFFPTNYHVDAHAIPFEQLDIVVRDSAPLAPFDLFVPDRAQILVPVPQQYYEPDLLKVETIDTEFDNTIERFTRERDQWLGHRLEVRRKETVIYKALKGEEPEYPDPDPDAIDNLELPAPFLIPLIEVGQAWRYLKGRAEPGEGWNGIAFDDNDWEVAPAGFGYGETQYETELTDMKGFYVCVYLRNEFLLAEEDVKKQFNVSVVTDGGFHAYVNGKLVHTHNVFSTAFNSAAKDLISPPATVEFILDVVTAGLVAGTNVIAIQIHNSDVDASSMTFSPRVTVKSFSAEVGEQDFGTQLMTVGDGEPDLSDDLEPQYTVTAIENLRTYIQSVQISEVEKNHFDEIGLEDYIHYLTQKVNNANDKVDFGFVRLQTDIYRIRQIMMGNVAGTKLATSPVLAEIANRETAVATKNDINDFVKAMGLTVDGNGGGNGGGNAPAPVSGSPAAPSRAAVFAAAATFGSTARRTGGSTFVADTKTLGGGATVVAAPEAIVQPGIGGATKVGTTIDLGGSIGGIVLGGRTILDTKETLKLSTAGSSGLFVSPSIPTKIDVEGQQAIVGKAEEFRNATVGERLSTPASSTAKDGGVASKADTMQTFMDVGIHVDDLAVPGFKETQADGKVINVSKTFEQIRTGNLIGEVIAGTHDPDVSDDESGRFVAGVRAMENVASILRIIEGRVYLYKKIITRCQDTKTELSKYLNEIDIRTKQIEDELAETRHDVSVARALKAEELARIKAVNDQRDKVIAEQVPFLVFRRPRLTEARVDMPIHTMNPDLSDMSLPACDIDTDEVPQEIAAFTELYREAPLKWFTISKKILLSFKRINEISEILKTAQLRARTKTFVAPQTRYNFGALNTYSEGISKTLLASQQLISDERQKVKTMDLSIINRLSWNESVNKAREVVSLGDVIDGAQGRPGSSQIASKELSDITRIGTCLYVRFGQVLPSIRLDWAERLSQYDASVNLRNLYDLPRWGEIDYIERNAMQSLVDWLYQRVIADFPEAVNLISDLIRIGILLASHAPVNKIIAGHVPEPTVVKPGGKIKIITDLSRVRIGMQVHLQSAGRIVAQGQIEDIAGGQVSARIVQTAEKSVAIEKNAKVQIGEARSLGGMQYLLI